MTTLFAVIFGLIVAASSAVAAKLEGIVKDPAGATIAGATIAGARISRLESRLAATNGGPT